MTPRSRFVIRSAARQPLLDHRRRRDRVRADPRDGHRDPHAAVLSSEYRPPPLLPMREEDLVLGVVVWPGAPTRGGSKNYHVVNDAIGGRRSRFPCEQCSGARRFPHRRACSPGDRGSATAPSSSETATKSLWPLQRPAIEGPPRPEARSPPCPSRTGTRDGPPPRDGRALAPPGRRSGHGPSTRMDDGDRERDGLTSRPGTRASRRTRCLGVESGATAVLSIRQRGRPRRQRSVEDLPS